jgi:hypothetical protein
MIQLDLDHLNKIIEAASFSRIRVKISDMAIVQIKERKQIVENKFHK